jgi:hypothetical protein
LAEIEPVFEGELGERETKDELLPREERPVKPASETLYNVSSAQAGDCWCRLTWRDAWIMIDNSGVVVCRLLRSELRTVVLQG